MIRYVGPGYLALATWNGLQYSRRVTVDLWCEWRGQHEIKTLLWPTRKGSKIGEPWDCTLRVEENGPPDHLLYMTLFSRDEHQPLYRYEGAGLVLMPERGTEIHINLGGS